MSHRGTGRPPALRLAALFLVFALCFLAVAARLFVLQLRDAPSYTALGRNQRVRHIVLPATRGSIYDRDGNDLAISLPARGVYANPQLVPNASETAAAIAPILDVSSTELWRKLQGEGSFVYLARRVAPEVAAQIERLRLPGIGLLDESRRQYPSGGITSHVVGFVGLDGVGLAGLELQYERILAGRPGELVVEKDPAGHLIPQGESRNVRAVPGADLVLTIDRDLQYRAGRALARAVKRNKAKGGTVIVMDPATGEILAMTTYPWFDANAPAKAPTAALRNRAITDVYEPGSVNKIITASVALEKGIVNTRQIFKVPDHRRVGPKIFHDAHPHPPMRMTLADIVAFSSNVGAIQVAQRVGKERLNTYLKRFGFGRRTGVGFPGEGEGILPPTDEWWETGIGTIPIGQGIAVTPLQVAAVYATIANGGLWVRPRLVRGVIDAEGKFQPAPPPDRRRVVSASTARTITSMLSYAVEAGTGAEAQIPGYWVAGKTGTARKPLEDARGYSDQYVASFVGFAPASAPQLVVAAILDEPETVYGSIAAAPLFQEVTRFALSQQHVPSARPLPPPPSAQRK
jgi:cell division protein FtsI (penicillin-binding protein 3)